MRIQLEELNGKSALDYCASLGWTVDTPDELLEVYRGDTLAYTVTSIKWGMCHRLVERDIGGFILKKRGKGDYRLARN